MPDVPPETRCEYRITSPAKLRSDYCTFVSFASHRSACKKKKQKNKHSAPADAKQFASAAVELDSKSAKRSRPTDTGGRSLPLKLGSTVNVIFGMRPDGRAVNKYTSAVIVDVARV